MAKAKWLLILLLFPLILFSQSTPLPEDDAFQFSAMVRDYQTVLLNWKIAPGYYLYQDRFHISAAKKGIATLAQPLLPVAEKKNIPGFGLYHVYHGNLTITLPVLQTTKPELLLKVHYQGCSVHGYCYPPTNKLIQVNMAGHYMQPTQPLNIDILPDAPKAPMTPVATEQDKIKSLLSGKSIWPIIIGFFIFGLLIAFTPCVLPMVPILSSIIVGQKKMTTSHAFLLSLSYVLGMAVTYAIVGLLFGFIGGNLQVVFQQPWIIILFTLLFIALAFSMFGYYDIQLPEKWRRKLAHASDHQQPGTYVGTFVMGIFSTLVLSPCVTPPLVAAIGYISQSGQASLGGLALFIMGLGMGTPLLLIGIAGGKWLPKSGTWMNVIKNIMGVMLLGVAIWMIQRILPASFSMVLWAGLFIGVSIWMGTFQSAHNPWQRVCKVIGLMFFIYSIVILVGALLGATNPLQPLPIHQQRAQQALKFTPVTTVADVKKAIATSNKPVMLDFYADWCISCKMLDEYTFSHKDVQQALSHYTLLRADITKSTPQSKNLQNYYGVIAPPTLIFFSKNAKEIPQSRVVGEMSANTFLAHLKQIKG